MSNVELERLSPWWRRGVIITLLFGFTVLIWLAVRTYSDGPPIPAKVADRTGATIFTRGLHRRGMDICLLETVKENEQSHCIVVQSDGDSRPPNPLGYMEVAIRFDRRVSAITANVECPRVSRQNG